MAFHALPTPLQQYPAERGEAGDVGEQDGGLFALLLARRHGMERSKPRTHWCHRRVHDNITKQRALPLKGGNRLLELFPLAHPVFFRRPAGTHGCVTRLTS